MSGHHSAATKTHIISRLFILCLASISFSPCLLLSAQSTPNTINMTPQTNNISTIPEGPVAGELEKLKQEEAHLGKRRNVSAEATLVIFSHFCQLLFILDITCFITTRRSFTPRRPPPKETKCSPFTSTHYRHHRLRSLWSIHREEFYQIWRRHWDFTIRLHCRCK